MANRERLLLSVTENVKIHYYFHPESYKVPAYGVLFADNHI